MKRIYIYFFLTAVVAGCVGNDFTPAETISFVAHLDGYSLPTKVAPIQTNSLKDFRMGLVAYTHDSQDTPQSEWQLLGTGVTELVYKEIYATSDPGRWAPKTDLFWPRNGRLVRFFAFAPMNILSVNTSGTSASGITAPYFEYTVPTALNEQSDILFATSGAIQDDPTMDGIDVPLRFNHMLAAVRLRAPDDIQITSVKISNIYGKGAFGADGKWKADQSATYDYTLAASGASLATETYVDENGDAYPDYHILTPAQTILVLPQTLPEEASIEVLFTTGSGSSAQSHKVAAIIAGSSWQKGCVYVYDLSESPSSGGGASGMSFILSQLENTETYLKGDDPLIR